MFIHHVYFWLKPDASPAMREQLVGDCRKLLKQISAVRQLWAGRPAGTEREVVDNSYDVALCVILDDATAHEVYQAHPIHKEFIARNQEHWARVRVYDFIDP